MKNSKILNTALIKELLLMRVVPIFCISPFSPTIHRIPFQPSHS